MTLKNTYSEVSVDRISQVIQKTLATHKAKQLMIEYGDKGRVSPLAFPLELHAKLHAFKLTAMVNTGEHILYDARPLTPTQKESGHPNRMERFYC